MFYLMMNTHLFTIKLNLQQQAQHLLVKQINIFIYLFTENEYQLFRILLGFGGFLIPYFSYLSIPLKSCTR